MKLKNFISIFSLSLFLLASPFTSKVLASSTTTSSPVKTEQAATTEPVTAHLISEQSSIQPGQKFWVGIELNMADGWDTYWINPGDSGFPTNVKWQLPDNFQVSNIQWPYPERFATDSLVAFGYTKSALLLAEVTPPENLPVGKDINIKADVNWLACKDQCLPGNAQLNLTLPVAKDVPKANDTAAAQFLKGRENLPKSLDQNAVSIKTKKDAIVVNFKPSPKQFDEISDVMFIPETKEMIDYKAPQHLQKKSQEYFLNVKRIDPKKELPNHVKGVLVISEKGSEIKKAVQIDMPLNGSQGSSAMHYEIALICAFVGGLILNVMPCVLPVISLKLFSFIKMAQEKRREIFKQGVLFTSGVIISFWVLSALLLILRASGQGIGWGFQLQEPMFVATLTLVLFLLGLSLFGVFELGTSMISVGDKISSKSSFLKGSFMSGVLATLVATPCTGPLLGPALGLAMTLPPFSSMVIFTAMGLGMASPYLIISAFPKLIRFLPKPGAWMNTFKQIMGFLMMGTCAWLIWVFVGQTDHTALFVLLISLLLFAIGAWIYGTWNTLMKKRRTRIMATCISLLILLMGGGMTYTAVQAQKNIAVVEKHEGQVFSAKKVEELRAEGKTVFVDFTAKWCLICQANKAVLHSAEIQKVFQENNIVFIEADWTKKDTEITKVLHDLGRSGVPVYVLYPADTKQPPIILPQTLTKSVVQDYVSKLNNTETVHVN